MATENQTSGLLKAIRFDAFLFAGVGESFWRSFVMLVFARCPDAIVAGGGGDGSIGRVEAVTRESREFCENCGFSYFRGEDRWS